MKTVKGYFINGHIFVDEDLSDVHNSDIIISFTGKNSVFDNIQQKLSFLEDRLRQELEQEVKRN